MRMNGARCRVTAFAIAVLLGGSITGNAAAQDKEQVERNRDTLIRTNACVGCDLSGADLNRLDLTGADLRSADLSGASFFLSDLSKADLSGAILRGAKFGGADLAEANLSGADFRGAQLDGAYTVGMIVDGSFVAKESIDEEAQLKTVEYVYVPDKDVPKQAAAQEQAVVGVQGQGEAARITGGDQPAAGETREPEQPSILPSNQDTPPVKTVSPVSDVTIGADRDKSEQTNGAGTAEPAKLAPRGDGKTPENSSVSTDDTKSEVAAAMPERAKMADESEPNPGNVDRSEAGEREGEMAQGGQAAERSTQPQGEKDDVPGRKDIASGEATSEGPAEIRQGGESEVQAETAAGRPEDNPSERSEQIERLLETNTCYACDLSGADLSGTDLEGADLEGADLSGADLSGADLRKANLKGAILHAANLQNADLRSADLYKADFRNADLTGADLKDTQKDEAVFAGAAGYGDASRAE